MKELIEEYGGVIAACVSGMCLLGIIYSLIVPGGGLHQLAKLFFEGIGTKVT